MRLPNIAADTINSVTVSLDEKKEGRWNLLINGVRWNCWNVYENAEVNELRSNVEIAYGKVIATGLGLCLREAMLLWNKNVTEIVVLENNKDVIAYHNKHNPDIMSKITVIHCDANEYIGSCDTLLLDHYEIYDDRHMELFEKGLESCTTNIKHDVLYWWALEKILEDYDDYLCHKQGGLKLPNMTMNKFEYNVLRFHASHEKDWVNLDNLERIV